MGGGRMTSPTPGPGIFEWQTAVLESIGIDAAQVASATIIMTGDALPRIIIEHIPGDDPTELHVTKQYRLTEVEVT